MSDSYENYYKQKLEEQKKSKFTGWSIDNSKEIKLVSERWEDCIQNYYDATRPSLERYIWVDNQRWLNVTYKSLADMHTIKASLEANGSYTDSRGNIIYGVY